MARGEACGRTIARRRDRHQAAEPPQGEDGRPPTVTDCGSRGNGTKARSESRRALRYPAPRARSIASSQSWPTCRAACASELMTSGIRCRFAAPSSSADGYMTPAGSLNRSVLSSMAAPEAAIASKAEPMTCVLFSRQAADPSECPIESAKLREHGSRAAGLSRYPAWCVPYHSLCPPEGVACGLGDLADAVGGADAADGISWGIGLAQHGNDLGFAGSGLLQGSSPLLEETLSTQDVLMSGPTNPISGWTDNALSRMPRSTTANSVPVRAMRCAPKQIQVSG